MWGFLSLLVCIIGALMYALSTNGKLQELGRLSFFAGLIAFLVANGAKIVALTGH